MDIYRTASTFVSSTIKIITIMLRIIGKIQWNEIHSVHICYFAYFPIFFSSWRRYHCLPNLISDGIREKLQWEGWLPATLLIRVRFQTPHVIPWGLQEWSLSVQPRISPEHSWVWPPNDNNSKNNNKSSRLRKHLLLCTPMNY